MNCQFVPLPVGSSLSVLVVETMPQITNIFERISRLDRPQGAGASESLVAAGGQHALREGATTHSGHARRRQDAQPGE
jgi:hypothetical protein